MSDDVSDDDTNDYIPEDIPVDDDSQKVTEDELEDIRDELPPVHINELVDLVEVYSRSLYKTLGPFMSECAYQRALVMHLETEESCRHLVDRVESEVPIEIKYTVGDVTRTITTLRMDIVVHTKAGDRLILELKHMVGNAKKTPNEYLYSALCQLRDYQCRYKSRFGAVVSFPKVSGYYKPPIDVEGKEKVKQLEARDPIVIPDHLTAKELEEDGNDNLLIALAIEDVHLSDRR